MDFLKTVCPMCCSPASGDGGSILARAVSSRAVERMMRHCHEPSCFARLGCMSNAVLALFHVGPPSTAEIAGFANDRIDRGVRAQLGQPTMNDPETGGAEKTP